MAVALSVSGAVLVTLGCLLVFVPFGLIVAGGFLLAVGLLVDFGGVRGKPASTPPR